MTISKFPPFIVLFAAILTQSAHAQTSADYWNYVRSKRLQILFNADSTVANSGDYKFGFTTAEAFFCAARFASNRSDSAKYVRLGRKVFDACFARMSATDASTGLPIFNVNTNFGCYAALACYTRYKHLLTDTAAVRQWAINYTFRGPGANSSNLTLMGAVGAYLAAQNFGVSNLRFGYSSTGTASADTKSGLNLIRSRLDDVHRGIGEIGSMPYGTFNLDPFLCVAELAEDPVLRQQTKMVFETAMAQYASVWLKGNLCMGSTRTYPHNASMGQVSFGLWDFLWFYFGGGGNPSVEGVLLSDKRGDHFNAAVRDYVLPEILYNIANDRSQPYTTIYSIPSASYESVFMSYIHRDYGVYTSSVRFGGTNAFKTGVKWNTPSFSSVSQVSSNCLWVTSPLNDSSNVSVGRIDQSDAENSFMYEGTLVNAYNGLVNTAGRTYALGFIPGGHLAFINESQSNNRIYLHYPNVLIAISATNPFVWNPNQRPLAAGADASINSSEFRVTDTATACFGVIIETAPPSSFSGGTSAQTLLNFRNAVSARALPNMTGKALDANAKPRLKYTDHKGNSFVLTFRGRTGASQDSVNGVHQNYLAMPSVSNRFISRDKAFTQNSNGSYTFDDGANMVVDYNGCRLIYNYAAWTVTNTCTLPVELRRFEATATEKGNVLTWETASEINNYGFEIERSFDAKTWTKIGFEKGKNAASIYAFTDDAVSSVTAPVVYYRLKQIDFNAAKPSFSKIVSVQRASLTDVSVFPTLVGDHIFVQNHDAEGELVITNALGQVVMRQRQAASVNVSALPSGAYWLQLAPPQYRGTIRTFRFVKP